MGPLLSREQFQTQVFARSEHRCVLCSAPAADAHHILERKLFSDGGYYLSNGAALCERCHWDCETTRVSPASVRTACGITQVVLPPGFTEKANYDKWGNRVWPSGLRSAGPLVNDVGMLRALNAGGVRGTLMPNVYCE